MVHITSASAAALFAVIASALPADTRQPESAYKTFDNITGSPQVSWEDCYGKFQCTLLTVPLDYQDSSAGVIDVAFLRYPYGDGSGQDILFNPGGPGVAPTTFRDALPQFASRWPGYNWVTFDPRGTGFTPPKFVHGPKGKSKFSQMRRFRLGTRTRSHSSKDLKDDWDDTVARNKKFTRLNEHTNAKYAGTMAVAQDMMHFTKLQASARGQSAQEAAVWYYGASYGTVLGQTLAALYPDHLGRMLLDANVNGVEYYQGWEPTCVDDDVTTYRLFVQYCFNAGAELCPLASGAENWDHVGMRFDALLDKLEERPVTIKTGSISNINLEKLAFRFFYSPHNYNSSYGRLARIALALELDDVDTLEEDRSFHVGADRMFRLHFIRGIDIAGRYPFNSFVDFENATHALKNAHPYHAEIYATGNGLTGPGFDIIPPESQFFYGFNRTNTSIPLLFVNTIGDPIAPRIGAYQMSKFFEGSRVLIQNSPGHGYWGPPSACTNEWLAAYWKNGTVPPEGTSCEIDVDASFYFPSQEGSVEMRGYVDDLEMPFY